MSTLVLIASGLVGFVVFALLDGNWLLASLVAPVAVVYCTWLSRFWRKEPWKE